MRFGWGVERRQSPPRASPPLRPAERIHPWDSHYPLLQLSPTDTLTMGQAFSSFSAMGSAGSGKTSIMVNLAYALMVAQCSFVWCCAKPSEVRLLRRIARASGREHDVIVIGLDVDGQLTDHRFNPIQYELSWSKAGTTSLIDYLSFCHDILSREEGKTSGSGGGDGDRFWRDQFRRLLRYCIDTAKLSGREIDVELLRDIQLSGPNSREDLIDAEQMNRRVFYQCLQEAEARLDRGEISEKDFKRVLAFWMNDYVDLDMKPKSTIAVMFASLLDTFYAEEADICTILTETSTVTPDDVIDGGKIVCLSMPTSIYGKAGRMAQACFKHSYQKRMLAREKPVDGSLLRPSVCWVDEAHQFAHMFDSEYFSEVRSNCGINVYLEQGVGGYMDALGVDSLEKLDRFLMNLTTKFWFQSGSPKTNAFAADVIGKRMMEQESDSESISSRHGDSANLGTSTTMVERHPILPSDFSSLRRGGPENGLIVDVIITKNGGTYNATGTNYLKTSFRQSDLTR